MSPKKKILVLLLILAVLPLSYTNLSTKITPEEHEKADHLNLTDANHGYDAELGIMLCLDVSSSMTPAMIKQTQDAAYLLLDLFSNDTYIGLVEYARYAYVNVSLNRLGEGTQEDDMKASIAVLTPKPYTNIFGGLMDSIEEFGGSTFTNKHIILMTDGYPNIADPGYSQFGTNPANIETWTTDPDSPILIANNSGICIHTVGLGGNYDQLLLENIANNTRCGEFYDAGESNELAMAFANIGNEVEGWENEETYYGDITDREMVHVTRYYIDTRYPFVRVWLTWDNPENYTLAIIVQDPNGENMTILDSGGNNPPSYAVYNCTDLDYIDIFLYGELVDGSTLEITTYGNNIASGNEYEAYTGGEADTTHSGDLGIVFCLDASISMNSEMVENAKHSAHLIMDLINNDTYVGIVTFARYSYVNVSLNRVNASNQASNIENIIDSMTTNPYTNIYAGLMDSIDQFEGYTFSSKHIILMSDGLANIADSGYEQFASRDTDVWTTDSDSPVLIANDSDILIHTVGFGSYNQPLLEAIASNTVSNISNGQFYDESETNALVMFFAELEGWQKQETYNDNVQEDETVLVVRYYIDDRYPYIRIWLFWDESEECLLEIIVKDHNADNMTSISNGGQNPPLYAYYNCTDIDYIDIYILGKDINNTINISWTCSIESNANYESSMSEGGDMLFFIIMILISMVSLAICTIKVRKNHVAKKIKREILEDIPIKSLQQLKSS